MAGSGIYRKCGYTSYACYVTPSAPFLHTVVDVLPAGIGQKHRPVVSFTGFHGAQALYLCLSVFEQRGGDLRGERLAPFLKKSVILPHDKLAGPVSAVVVFLALVDVLAAAGTSPNNHALGLKQFLLNITVEELEVLNISYNKEHYMFDQQHQRNNTVLFCGLESENGCATDFIADSGHDIASDITTEMFFKELFSDLTEKENRERLFYYGKTS